jgi:hypothetical protein
MSPEPEEAAVADEQPEQATPQVSTEKAEPAISTGAVITAATLLFDGLILFGVQVGAEQKTYLLSVVTLLAPMITSLIIRTKVWSGRSVMAIVEQHKIQLAEKEREADLANARAAAAHAAVTAVQGLIAPPPQRPAEPPRSAPAPQGQRPVPDRVYGLYGGQERDPVGRINPRTRVQPAVEPRPQQAAPPTDPDPLGDPGGFYRYSEAELDDAPRAPRGIRPSGPRHSMPGG